MTQTQETKLRAIIVNYINGNRADAKAAIVKLKKLDLAQLLVNPHQCLYLAPCDTLRFNDFVIDALEA